MFDTIRSEWYWVPSLGRVINRMGHLWLLCIIYSLGKDIHFLRCHVNHSNVLVHQAVRVLKIEKVAFSFTVVVVVPLFLFSGRVPVQVTGVSSSRVEW